LKEETSSGWTTFVFRKFAARSLVQTGPGCLPALQDTLTTGDRDLSEIIIMKIYGKLGAESVSYLSEALKDEREHVGEFAARALGDMGPQAADAIPHLIISLKARGINTRAASAEALGKIGPDHETVLGALEAALKDKSWKVRKTVQEVLETIGNPE